MTRFGQYCNSKLGPETDSVEVYLYPVPRWWQDWILTHILYQDEHPIPNTAPSQLPPPCLDQLLPLHRPLRDLPIHIHLAMLTTKMC